jgi:uncharacterized protein (TIGR03084 family)
MKDLIKDLSEEYESLDNIVSPLAAAMWDRETPFSSWTIRDEICHLAWGDDSARLTATDPEGFSHHKAETLALRDMFEDPLAKGRALSVAELLSWWRSERGGLLDVFSTLDAKTRLSWFGLPMSSRSLVTSRIMETWAHGQDICDALGRNRLPTDRLRHIAHLGVSTFSWSFQNRGIAPPTKPIHIELSSAAGALWTWGPPDSDERISGNAEDFCLVVTQRRHIDDTALEIMGSFARQWMLIAQAFAGPPVEGPKPGQFSKKRWN